MLTRVMSSAEGRRYRYAAVVLAGAAFDLGFAMALSTFTPLPLSVAAAISFCTATIINYLLFEFWTFSHGRTAQFSLGRLAGTGLAALLALGVRVGVIEALGFFADREFLLDLVRLTSAMGCSLIVNYVAVRSLFPTPGGVRMD
jgi:putative flippase GtrA